LAVKNREMEELAEIRNRIDEIDRRIAQLFEMRMSECKKVGIVKKRIGAQILDAHREEEVLESRERFIHDKKITVYWIEVVKCLMKVSKEYQWNLREDCPSPKK